MEYGIRAADVDLRLREPAITLMAATGGAEGVEVH